MLFRISSLSLFADVVIDWLIAIELTDFSAHCVIIKQALPPFFFIVIHCEEDKAANNVVPIAVGAALAILVIIVLVLYLIGRRKHQKGYQTV